MDNELERLIKEVNQKIEERPVAALGKEKEQIIFSVHEEEGNNYVVVYGDFEKNMKAIPEIGILLNYVQKKGYEIRCN